jgi:tRNA1Val (adenine37-N6)-methyltransferase
MTDDRFLGGRVIVRQMQSGFRAGLDAVMLAAAVPARAGDEILELGAGAGTASLCLASRVSGTSIVGVEIDPALATLANENATANSLDMRVRFATGDVFVLPAELRRDFAHVLCNPPFHDEEGEVSPDAGRDMALRDKGRLGDWMELGLKRTASGGTFTAIIRADRLSDALARLPERGVSIFPLWPRSGEPAKRVIVRAIKGARTASSLQAGLVLHNGDGSYTPEANAVLRDGAALTVVRG